MGGTGDDAGYGIAVDALANVYVTGYFEDTATFGSFSLTSAGSEDIFISKLDNNGNFVYAKQLGGTDDDVGNAIAVDGSGNVYTTGYFADTADFDPATGTFNLTSIGSSDIFISKLLGVTGTLSASISSGILTVTDIGNKANTLSISIVGGNLVIADTTEQFLSAPSGWTLAGDGKSIFTPVGSFTGSIILNTSGGDDSLTVNHSGGVIANPITYNGGDGVDSLQITGGGFVTGNFSYTGPAGSSVALSGAGLLSYADLESLNASGSTISNLLLSLPTSPSAASLSNTGPNLQLAGSTVTNTTFAPPPPAGSLTLNAGTLTPVAGVGILSTGNYTQTGNLTIEIVNPTSPATAGVHYDQVNVTGTVTLNPGATLTLAFVGSGQVPVGTVYTLIANDGTDAVVGTFAGLPQGKIFTANGQRWQISYTGGDGNDVTLRALPPGNRLAVGAGTAAVGNPVVVYNPDLSVNSTANPYPQFAGGVRVASADVNGDGIADLITAPGVGGGPHIQVFDGVSGALLNSFFAFEDTFRGGAFVAGGDLDGDGLAEVVVSADVGGGPRVVVFRGSAVASGQFVNG